MFVFCTKINVKQEMCNEFKTISKQKQDEGYLFQDK